MLLVDEDVGDGALASQVFQCSLDCRAVIYILEREWVSRLSYRAKPDLMSEELERGKKVHTNFIELN